MNKLDYLDALNFNGKGSINDIFEQLGRIDAPTRQFTSEDNDNTVELKATTVRVPVDLLGAFDATLSHFQLTRQDAFAYMLHQFIADSISGYCFGKSDTGEQEHECISQAVMNFDELTESIPEEHRAMVRRIAAHALNMKLGGDYATA